MSACVCVCVCVCVVGRVHERPLQTASLSSERPKRMSPTRVRMEEKGRSLRGEESRSGKAT